MSVLAFLLYLTPSDKRPLAQAVRDGHYTHGPIRRQEGSDTTPGTLGHWRGGQLIIVISHNLKGIGNVMQMVPETLRRLKKV